MTARPCFADVTTIGVGGQIADFIQPETRDDFIAAVMTADDAGRPLCVLGGGSNLLASDEDFDGVVVRDARRTIAVQPSRSRKTAVSCASRRMRASTGTISWLIACSMGMKASRGCRVCRGRSAHLLCRTSAPMARKSLRPF